MTVLTPSKPAQSLPQIECGTCQQKLPLRLTHNGEPAAVWRCAKCDVPFVACCVAAQLLANAKKIRLDERSFDVTGQAAISLRERQHAIELSSRHTNTAQHEQRRSKRVAQSLVVPAIKLGPNFVPEGEPFQIMVANLSKEGVGLVHNEPIDSEHIAIEFSPSSHQPIQVIARVVRQRELTPPYHEIGGEFLVRLGSTTQ